MQDDQPNLLFASQNGRGQLKLSSLIMF